MEKHKEPCVVILGDTYAYLADGTKIVIRRNRKEQRAWLEVIPQAKVHANERKEDHRYGGWGLDKDGKIVHYDTGSGNPMKNGG